jgi:hypothetical protein
MMLALVVSASVVHATVFGTPASCACASAQTDGSHAVLRHSAAACTQ